MSEERDDYWPAILAKRTEDQAEIASLRAQLSKKEIEWQRECMAKVAAEAQLASARKALEPFAEIAKELSPAIGDKYKNTLHWAVPTAGELRAALTALTDEKGAS